jgi:repressor LexA
MYLTRRQLQIVDFVRDYRQKNRISPTLDEIARQFGVSKITIFEHVEALKKKGVVRKVRNHARSIELIGGESASESLTLPLLGTVSAGRPIEAVENAEAFSLTSLVPQGKECFALRVQGTSMIDEQIRDGDLIIVEKRAQARNGEMVVALVDGGETTVKKFYREGDRIRLQPANTEMPPIYPEKVHIQGIVIGVVRRY